ncbi:hypothetical protein RND81_08G156500 [Saponaria officinalis]|uniref:DOG1 domain-containing protein n=1 Tax=Saponaria officinalis TaxID=3572 RepID=A0AAW1J7T6_SAPOF
MLARENATPRTTSNVNISSSSSYFSFEEFLRGWHRRQDDLLAEITTAVEEDMAEGGEDAAKELIARALAHFEEYYVYKSRAAYDDVFSLFSPTCCSSFECAFMWNAGFRPGVLLELVFDSVRNLSPRQTEAIYRLKRQTRMEEKQISDEIARIQETVAAPSIMQSLRDGARCPPMEDQPFNVTTNEAVGRLQGMLEEVMAKADTLRVSTAANVAEILIPAQGLRFLAAALRVQQGMRKLSRTIGGDSLMM